MTRLIFFLIIIASCGKNSKNIEIPKNVYISYEKNEFLCNNCLLLNIEQRVVQVVFDQQNEFHECTGSYNFRNISTESVIVPKITGITNEYQLEYTDSSTLSDCLTEVLDFSIKNLTNNTIEIYMNNEKYRLKK